VGVVSHKSAVVKYQNPREPDTWATSKNKVQAFNWLNSTSTSLEL